MMFPKETPTQASLDQSVWAAQPLGGLQRPQSLVLHATSVACSVDLVLSLVLQSGQVLAKVLRHWSFVWQSKKCHFIARSWSSCHSSQIFGSLYIASPFQWSDTGISSYIIRFSVDLTKVYWVPSMSIPMPPAFQPLISCCMSLNVSLALWQATTIEMVLEMLDAQIYISAIATGSCKFNRTTVLSRIRSDSTKCQLDCGQIASKKINKMLDVQVNRPAHCRLQQRLQKLVGAEFDGHQEVLANRLQFDWQTFKNRLKTWKQTEILWKHTSIGLCEEFVKEPEGALHQFYSSCYASDIRPHPRDFWDFRSGSVREKCLWSAKVTSLSNEVQGDESMGQVFFGKKTFQGSLKTKKTDVKFSNSTAPS